MSVLGVVIDFRLVNMTESGDSCLGLGLSLQEQRRYRLTRRKLGLGGRPSRESW
ncbi:hypothetical protein [Haladaptatus halobius]|uniref:hypothetical protein n=1 Tax=Haladaptatus halobius TaxID=2884875 RepID=UPI001D09A2E4|nr:hypothetical protein [Haladaptatus halobius]